MRSNRDTGVKTLVSAALDNGDERPEWMEIRDVFGYDAEDAADNWWIEWGLLRERAKGSSVLDDLTSFFHHIHVAQVTS